ncbi:unnamed protein product [Symbiodinium necroappetens]|uniref:Uncharacterized protein n=1 Tax=Symbiodinium necroappetens TaxID=1628268 RepID=A0A812ZT32_9DINO|nr:unnamed protein product [Symbiodinium necroappetens]
MMQHCFRTSLDIACHGSASFESSSMSYALRATATVARAALSLGIPTTDSSAVWYALRVARASAALSSGIPTTDSHAVWYALRVARASAALSSGIPTTDSHAVWYALPVARASAVLSFGIPISGANYEHMMYEVLQQVLPSSSRRKLMAGSIQDREEEDRLTICKQKVAHLLQLIVSDTAAVSMQRRGHGQSEAEVDLVFQGSFEEFDNKFGQLGEVNFKGSCEMVRTVLVEICSDSRFVPMKLYQIEIQSCLIARAGKLDGTALQPDATGFAIVFNRAAIHIGTHELVNELGLVNVQSLLDNQKLHIVYFQAEAVTPAAMKIASDAKAEAKEAKEKVDMLEKQLASLLPLLDKRAQPLAP